VPARSAGGTGDGEGNGLAATVELRAITKWYGRVCACDGVDLTLEAGQVHGLLGGNGAGKSTVMKILIGLVRADAGTIRIDGRPVTIHDPLVAAAHGIAMVHQHDSLVEPLTVWENVVLGARGRLDRAAARRAVRAIGDRYGLEVDPDARVSELGAAHRQRVELVACLRRDPRIVVLDEPTSVLTPAESRQLFTVLREVVAAEGRTVVLVSHKLDEVLHATDVITVMRQGRVVDHRPTSSVDAAGLARAMVGREVSLRAHGAALGLSTVTAEAVGAGEPEHTGAPDDTGVATVPVLRLEGVRVIRRDGSVALDDLHLGVRAGEIVGVAGVDGNGQRELADLLSSLVRADRGVVAVAGARVATGRAGAMAAAGVGVIPEDRHDAGCVLDLSVAENLVLAVPGAVAVHGVMNRRAMRARARALMEEFGIAAPDPDTPMRQLSGGNQQRVVLARELSAQPRVLVAAQPTRGLDIGAVEDVRDRLRAAAAAGVGVLLISSDLDEILDLSHRVVVLSRGRIVGEMDRRPFDPERIGRLMAGAAG
jgi:ABC-type uncharacterized transport system ATPase subunit